ncbi:Energy-coupling factor transporter ATP-binding protein EcfA1 [Corynebacterium glaucum]|uniref:Energy-coupling factor transporter ATP-binding protein EcfA1 n=1 Tax=Corynebacterium glaucum TaxID=187491 RepID=A0A1Q2HVX6_9CORY|nr:ATP-binding cassette domain-containing protein [Corynebacterium glaucum]AQQ14982.1 Energy-coupling factor transporter ATP-binding protein EcfA1 [Corynebacterium glaucum]
MDLTPLIEALERHDTVEIIGNSGSGLTTLANQIHETWPHAAVVGQDPIAHITFLRDTVIEEVAIGLEQHGVPREEMQARCEAILAAAGLAELAEHNPTKLSGGQTRRLAIAAVAILEPEILVLDDPFAGLDPNSAARIATLLRSLPSKLVLLGTRPRMAGEQFTLIDASLQPHTQPPTAPVLPAKVTPPVLPALDLGEVAATRGGKKRKWWQFRGAEEPVFTAGPIHLVARPGEVVWLRGANGAGKTTLLRALAGLDGNPGLEKTHGITVSLALQRAADQLAESTVRAFVDSDEALARLAEPAGSLPGIAFDPDSHPIDLPAAHLRLVQLAQVFAQGRQLVLLDEPNVGLDAPGRERAHALIADALANGQAIIMTCHDETFAAEVGEFGSVTARKLLAQSYP